MWNRKRSVKLSIAVCLIMALIIGAAAAALPFVYGWYSGYRDYSEAGLLGHADIVLFIAVFVAVMIVYFAFYQLLRLLINIKRNEIFISDNVRSLRIISWCCFAVSAVLFATTLLIAPLHFVTLLMVAVAAAFGGLLLRVVKNVMQTALELREENELTI